MSDESCTQDPRGLWREQPQEVRPVLPAEFLQRRMRDLSASTRSEILTSAASALLFLALLAWRFEIIRDKWVLASFALIVVWAALTVYRHRKQLWRSDAELASPGVDYYRAELERRRAHLRDPWLWHGPLALACVTLAAVGIRKVVPGWQRFISVLPLLAALVVWSVMGVRRRLRQAAAIQEEIDEIARYEKN